MEGGSVEGMGMRGEGGRVRCRDAAVERSGRVRIVRGGKSMLGSGEVR